MGMLSLINKERENDSATSGYLPVNVKEILEESSIHQNIDLNQELSSILSNDDYKSINNELQALKLLSPDDSTQFKLQKEKIIGTLQDFKNNGKLTQDEFENIMEKVNEDILKTKEKMEEKVLLNRNNIMNKELQSLLSDD